MPKTWNRVPIANLRLEAESLLRSANRLLAACKSFESAGIDEPWATWTDEIPRKIAAIATFVSETCGEVEDQLTSKRYGTQCHVERAKERAAKEIERRRKVKTALNDAYLEAKSNVESRGLVKPVKKKPAKKKAP